MKTTALQSVAKEFNRLNKVMESNKEKSIKISEEADKWGKAKLPMYNMVSRFKLNRN